MRIYTALFSGWGTLAPQWAFTLHLMLLATLVAKDLSKYYHLCSSPVDYTVEAKWKKMRLCQNSKVFLSKHSKCQLPLFIALTASFSHGSLDQMGSLPFKKKKNVLTALVTSSETK